jgi:hypothetical protein
MAAFTTAEVNGWFQTIDGLPSTTAPIGPAATTYVDELNATPQTSTPAEIVDNLENFPNSVPTPLFYRTTVAQFVLREFQAAWGVVPTDAQYMAWMERCLTNSANISGGMSMALAGTTQFMTLYGTTSATEPATLAFVTQLWHNTVGAGSPGPGALANVGQPVWQVLQNFASSNQFIQNIQVAPTVGGEPAVMNFQDLLLAGQTPAGSIFSLPVAPPFSPGQGQTFTLTTGVDTPTSGFGGNGATATVAGSVFVAGPAGNPPLGTTNTLNTGDDLVATGAAAGATTLNYTAVNNFLANPAYVLGLTTSGVSSLNITNSASVIAGFQGSITGLTTVTDSSSVNGVQLGATGQGLLTALGTVNINNYGAAAQGTTVFAGFISAGVALSGETIAIGISGALGATGRFQADKILFAADSGPGTAASPNLGYGTWSITSNSNNNLQLEQDGVGSATGLTLSGSGNIAVGQDAAGNWQSLTTINAAQDSGTVVITGASSGPGVVNGNAFATVANPGWLFGSAAGLLNDPGGTFALTTFDLGTGLNKLDVSSATVAQMAKLTTTPAATVNPDNEIIVNDTVATTGLALTAAGSPFANINGFDNLGVTGIGGAINMSNLPSSIAEILWQTPAAGSVSITNQAATLTVDVEDNSTAAQSLTVSTSGGAETLNLILGNPNHTGTGGFGSGVGNLGPLTTSGDDIVNITPTSGEPGTVADNLGTMSLTPTLAGAEAVTFQANGTGITDPAADTGLNIGSAGDGAIWDISGVSGGLNPFNLTVTDDSGAPVWLQASTAGPAATLGYSTNAYLIDASKAGGFLVMEGGDANYFPGTTVAASKGDTIEGAPVSGNVLIGSLGNDTITSASTSGGDQIVTEGGSNTISLASTTGDTVDVFAGVSTGATVPVVSHIPNLGGVPGAGNIVNSVAGVETASQGWWGVGAGGTSLPGLAPGDLKLHDFATSAGSATSADLSIVSGANNSANGTGDVIGFSIGAWDGFLTGTNGTAAVLANANLSNLIGIGGTLTAPAANIIDVGVGMFNSAATLANSIAAGGITLSSNMGVGDHSFLVAYQNSANGGGVTVADLFVDNATGAATNKIIGGAHETIAVSDMVELTGVNLANLSNANFHLIA